MGRYRVIWAPLFMALSACTPRQQPTPKDISTSDLATLLHGTLLEAEKDAEQEFWIQDHETSRVVALRKLIPLGPAEVAVVTRSQEAYEEDGHSKSEVGHDSGGNVDVHYLRWDGFHWLVDTSYYAAMSLGANGEFGDIEIIEPKSGLKALLIHSGGSWQGYSIEAVDMILLDHTKPHSVFNAVLSSDNLGACMPEIYCWQADSKLTIKKSSQSTKMAEIQIKQSLTEEPSPEKQDSSASGQENGTTAEDESQSASAPEPTDRKTIASESKLRFVWNGHKYILRSGKNIVPSI